MAMSKISVGFEADTTGLVRGTKAASNSIDKFSRELKGLNGTMGLVKFDILARGFASITSGITGLVGSVANVGKGLFDNLSAAVEEATNIGEQISKSGQIFGDAAGEIRKFAESAEAIGLSTSAALDATGTFGNLFNAMKLTSDVSAEYSLTMTKLAADLASFNNTSVDDAVSAIGAALRGEAEPIRRFGVLLDEATLKQIAFREGMIKTEKEALTPAIKAQAAYKAILEQTVAAQGDFARTSEGLANMTRVVQAQTQNLLGDVGKIFEPVFLAATSAFSKILTEVRPVLAELSKGITDDIKRLSDLILGLVPSMKEFLQSLDGESLGKLLGKGIIEATRTFAQVADFAIAGFRDIVDLVRSLTGKQSEAEKRLATLQGQVAAGTAPVVGGNPLLGEPVKLDPAFVAQMEALTRQIERERAAWDSFSLVDKFDELTGYQAPDMQPLVDATTTAGANMQKGLDFLAASMNEETERAKTATDLTIKGLNRDDEKRLMEQQVELLRSINDKEPALPVQLGVAGI